MTTLNQLPLYAAEGLQRRLNRKWRETNDLVLARKLYRLMCRAFHAAHELRHARAGLRQAA